MCETRVQVSYRRGHGVRRWLKTSVICATKLRPPPQLQRTNNRQRGLSENGCRAAILRGFDTAVKAEASSVWRFTDVLYLFRDIVRVTVDDGPRSCMICSRNRQYLVSISARRRIRPDLFRGSVFAWAAS